MGTFSVIAALQQKRQNESAMVSALVAKAQEVVIDNADELARGQSIGWHPAQNWALTDGKTTKTHPTMSACRSAMVKLMETFKDELVVSIHDYTELQVKMNKLHTDRTAGKTIQVGKTEAFYNAMNNATKGSGAAWFFSIKLTEKALEAAKEMAKAEAAASGMVDFNLD